MIRIGLVVASVTLAGTAHAESALATDLDLGISVGYDVRSGYGTSSIGVAASGAVGKRVSPGGVVLARLRISYVEQGYGAYLRGTLAASGIWLLGQVWLAGELGVAVAGNDGAHCYSNADGIGAHLVLGVGLPMSTHVALVGEGMATTFGDVLFTGGVRITWY